MASILQSLTFCTDSKARLGPCPLGSVWTVLVSVPQATNSSSVEVYLQGTQLGSMQGTATFGPFQMRGNEVLTIVSTGAQVTAAQTVTVMGQADAEKDAPTGIFPVVSGGVVTTAGSSYPLSAPMGGALSSPLSVPANTLTAVFTTPNLAAGTWLLTLSACPRALNGAALIEFEVVEGTAVASFSGSQSASSDVGATQVLNIQTPLVCLAVVTSTGTLVFQTEATLAYTLESATPGFSFPQATGWTATRVA